ncbi:hypothetical protein C7H19_00565 [Aphanothece hegewaldii CCALA 016]|uniref:Uncharacterized protein n=1 Tax=Aphanothece hegewaldii CCALA 016 TaxID=2107694 RepID=A0A2T1M3A9_9CHRO|nr:antibiotic biosynthesis monooxygenase [Aphanothece hegewaldii]PSF39315.1 hypothetical protein C7H19_00565 [Aphanothece hegewaldii CCALA 016]
MNKSDELFDPPVTVSITRRVKPGCEKAFEEFVSGITAAAMTFEGHLGATIIRPSNPAIPEYRVIFKFDRRSNLEKWENSECRRQWLAREKVLIVGSPVREVLTGLETWFTLPAYQEIIPPPRYKMAAITFIAIFPLIKIVSYSFKPVLVSLPSLLQEMMATGLIVLLMTYVVMPRMTRLFAFWLYPYSRKSRR